MLHFVRYTTYIITYFAFVSNLICSNIPFKNRIMDLALLVLKRIRSANVFHLGTKT